MGFSLATQHGENHERMQKYYFFLPNDYKILFKIQTCKRLTAFHGMLWALFNNMEKAVD